MRFSFSRGADGLPNLDDADSLKEFLGATRNERRGPLQVTEPVRTGAAERLTRLANERAAKFQRERPTIEDFKAAAADHPALLRLSLGDVVADSHLAEVS